MRNKSIDIAKGIAILLVILGHISITPLILKYWLYSFHIPLFFICSGILFSNKNKEMPFLSFAKKKARRLLVPYFSLGIILWLCVQLLSVFTAYTHNSALDIKFDIIGLIKALLLGHRLHEYYFSMWFICTLFISELLFYFVVRICKNTLLFGVLIIVLIYGSSQLFKYIKGTYWSMDLVFVCIAFLSVGYLLRKHSLINKLCNKKLLLPVLLLNISFMYLNFRKCGMTDLFYCNIGNPLYYLCESLFGSWLVLIISMIIETSKLFEFLGRNSLIVYIFQGSFTISLAVELCQLLQRISDLFSDVAFQFLFVTTMTLIISGILVKLINRFLPWCVGKRLHEVRFERL